MVCTATRLLPFAGRQMDHHSRRIASEAAADTASVIFYQVCHCRFLVYPSSVSSLESRRVGRRLAPPFPFPFSLPNEWFIW